MKTINLSSHQLSVIELLRMARNDALLVKSQDGDTFIISTADEFDSEVELLRQNHSFLAMLDEFKKEENTISFEEVERNLR
ncbi:MAG: hypothetical protein JRJ77_15445 [Deltaproteobacteria bacterium]|nr:hypothetical protein [Deltaproteobacteria bacterium]MCD6265106.1 hypothetical protein [Deltaproteobacteria bacterium]RLB25197.1 MAG: hypothetical protein DRG73_02470 [Deltaproteobacteria bacterium]